MVEPVRFTSLDEAFDEDMRALLAAGSVAPPDPGDPELDRLFAFLREVHGLAPLGAPPPPPAGGLLRRLMRRLFVTRTYHAVLFTVLGDLVARQRRLEERLVAERAEAERRQALAARVVFRLWGDYNHLTRSVLDHHVNQVIADVQARLVDAEGRLRQVGEAIDNGHAAGARRHEELITALREARADTTALREETAAEMRGAFEGFTARLEELTGAVRDAEARLNEMALPHDQVVESVSELIAMLGREMVQDARLDALEATGAPARASAGTGAEPAAPPDEV